VAIAFPDLVGRHYYWSVRFQSADCFVFSVSHLKNFFGSVSSLLNEPFLSRIDELLMTLKDTLKILPSALPKQNLSGRANSQHPMKRLSPGPGTDSHASSL